MNKELVKEAASKQAALWDTLKTGLKLVAPPMAAAGVIVGGSKFLDVMFDYFEKKSIKAKSREYYAKMLEVHPQLKKMDPKKVAMYWESLMHFAPSMAEDPLASGAFITQSINRLSGEDFGGPPADTFATLVNMQDKMKSQPKQPDRLRDIVRRSAIEKGFDLSIENVKNPDNWG